MHSRGALSKIALASSTTSAERVAVWHEETTGTVGARATSEYVAHRLLDAITSFVSDDEFYWFVAGLARIYMFYREQSTGATQVTFERFNRGLEEESDARWLETLARSQETLARLATEAYADYLAGRTEDFDPDADSM